MVDELIYDCSKRKCWSEGNRFLVENDWKSSSDGLKDVSPNEAYMVSSKEITFEINRDLWRDAPAHVIKKGRWR